MGGRILIHSEENSEGEKEHFHKSQLLKALKMVVRELERFLILRLCDDRLVGY